MRRDPRWSSGPTTQPVEQATCTGPPKVGPPARRGLNGNGSLIPSCDPHAILVGDSLRGATAWGAGTPPTKAGPGLVTADSSNKQTAADSTDAATASYQCYPQLTSVVPWRRESYRIRGSGWTPHSTPPGTCTTNFFLSTSSQL